MLEEGVDRRKVGDEDDVFLVGVAADDLLESRFVDAVGVGVPFDEEITGVRECVRARRGNVCQNEQLFSWNLPMWGA